jgi:hypothetical protein
LGSRRLALRTRLDIWVYLVAVVFAVVIAGAAGLGVAAATGLVHDTNHLMAHLPQGSWSRLAVLTFSVAPVTGFVWTYQRRSLVPLRTWELPAYTFAFVVYTYGLVLAQVWAWARMLTGRSNWAKTART